MKTNIIHQGAIALGLLFIIVGFQNCGGGNALDKSYYVGRSQTPGDSGDPADDGNNLPGSLIINSQSSSIARLIGEDVVLNVSASGSDNILYQWYKDDTPISGANHNLFSLTNLTAADAGVYYVIAYDGNGVLNSRQSADISLTVSSDPKTMTFNDPGYVLNGIKHVLYTFGGQSQEDRVRWQNLYCRALTNNPAATVVSATTAPPQKVQGDAYPSETAVSCPNDIIINGNLIIDFTYVGNGVCARTWNSASEDRIPFTQLVCRVP